MIVQRIWLRLQQGLPNTLLFMSVTAAAGLVSGVIVARYLGPEGRGQFAVIVLWPAMMATISELGLGMAFTYYAGKNRESISALWSLAWVFSLLIGGVVGLVGMLILPSLLALSEMALVGLRWNLAAVPVVLLGGYLCYLLLGVGCLVEFNLVRVCTSICYFFGVTAVVLIGAPDILTFTAAYILAQLGGCILAIAFSVSRLHPVWLWKPFLIKPVFTYGMKTYASGLMAQANLRLDQLFMSIFILPVELGFYAVAVAISGLVSPLYSAVAVAVLPRVTQAPSRLLGGRVAIRHLWLVFLGGVPLTIVLCIAMPLLLPLLFGDGYHLSIFPAQVLLVAAFFQGCVIVLGNSLRGLGCPGKTAISEGIGLIMTVGLLFVLLPTWGIIGAALASLVAYGAVGLSQTAFLLNNAGLGWSALWPSVKYLHVRTM